MTNKMNAMLSPLFDMRTKAIRWTSNSKTNKTQNESVKWLLLILCFSKIDLASFTLTLYVRFSAFRQHVWSNSASIAAFGFFDEIVHHAHRLHYPCLVGKCQDESGEYEVFERFWP